MKKSLISLGILLLLVAGNYFFFSFFSDTGYFEWYLKGGPLISLSIAFISLIWNDLDKNENLISADPANFLPGSLWVVAVVFASMANNLRRVLAPTSADSPMPSLTRLLWDSAITLVIYPVLFTLAILWLLIVVPLMYFSYLVAGAPARMGLLNPILSTQVTTEDNGRTKVVKEVYSKEIGDKDSLDVTFTRKPVTITAAIAAILLWLVGFAVEFFTKGGIAH